MEILSSDLCGKTRDLRERLCSMERLVVAFSGGRDSLLLLHEAIAALGPENVRPVTAKSPIRPAQELRAAETAAAFCGAEHTIVETHELSLLAFRANGPDRCRVCKIHLFSILRDMADSDSIDHVVDGVNATELAERDELLLAPPYLGVESPLAEAGLTRRDVRRLIDVYEIPMPSPKVHCLASRVSMGIPLTAALMSRVEEAEAYLRDEGFSEAIVRLHSDGLARIKVPPAELDKFLGDSSTARISQALCEMGFANAAVDLDGV